MAQPRTVHVVRLGTAGAALNSWLRGHEDGVSWTSDAALAIPFATAEAAKRYAARRLGGAWHVAEVDRAERIRLVLADEVDAWPEVAADAAPERRAPESILVTRAQGEALAARRRAIRAVTSTPRAA